MRNDVMSNMLQFAAADAALEPRNINSKSIVFVRFPNSGMVVYVEKGFAEDDTLEFPQQLYIAEK